MRRLVQGKSVSSLVATVNGRALQFLHVIPADACFALNLTLIDAASPILKVAAAPGDVLATALIDSMKSASDKIDYSEYYDAVLMGAVVESLNNGLLVAEGVNYKIRESVVYSPQLAHSALHRLARENGGSFQLTLKLS